MCVSVRVWVCGRVGVWVVPLVESPVFGHVISNLHRQITLQVKFPQCCTSTCYHVHLPSNLCDLVSDSATTTTAAAAAAAAVKYYVPSFSVRR